MFFLRVGDFPSLFRETQSAFEGPDFGGGLGFEFGIEVWDPPRL